MCGRYSLSLRPEDLSARIQALNMALDDIENGRQATISHNVGPSNYGAVYRSSIDPHRDEGKTTNGEKESGTPPQEKGNVSHEDSLKKSTRRTLQYMKWGLVPSYFADQKSSYKMINCRSESLAENKSVWAGPKKHNRCLIPVEGFYEWIGTGKNKVPYYVRRRDGNLIFLAGLWDHNTKGGKEDLYSFTIITTPSAPEVEWLHERMPVIINPDDELVEDWLNPDIIWRDNSQNFVALIKPFDVSDLEVYKVSTDVNKMGVDRPDLNKPVEAATFFGKKDIKKQRKKVKEGRDEEEPEEGAEVKEGQKPVVSEEDEEPKKEDNEENTEPEESEEEKKSAADKEREEWEEEEREEKKLMEEADKEEAEMKQPKREVKFDRKVIDKQNKKEQEQREKEEKAKAKKEEKERERESKRKRKKSTESAVSDSPAKRTRSHG